MESVVTNVSGIVNSGMLRFVIIFHILFIKISYACFNFLPHQSIIRLPSNSALLKIGGPFQWITGNLSDVILEFSPPLLVNIDYTISKISHSLPSSVWNTGIIRRSKLILHLRPGKYWAPIADIHEISLNLTNIYCMSSNASNTKTSFYPIQVARIIPSRHNCPLSFPVLPHVSPTFQSFVNTIIQECQNPLIFKPKELFHAVGPLSPYTSLQLIDIHPPVIFIDGSEYSTLKASKTSGLNFTSICKLVDLFLTRFSVLHIGWEPIAEHEPWWWVLNPYPAGMPGHLFAMLDILQWTHPLVTDSKALSQWHHKHLRDAGLDAHNPSQVPDSNSPYQHMHAHQGGHHLTRSRWNHSETTTTSAHNMSIPLCTRDVKGCVPGCAGTKLQTISPSGFAASIHFLMQGLGKSLHLGIPMQIAPISLPDRKLPPVWTSVEGWMYTYGSCASHFLDCVYLDHSPCPPMVFDVERPGQATVDAARMNPRYGNEDQYHRDPDWWDAVMRFGVSDHGDRISPSVKERTIQQFRYRFTPSGHVMYTYMFRPAFKVRHKVHQAVEAFNLMGRNYSGAQASSEPPPHSVCAVMHVRRGDVLMHVGMPRPYYHVSAYLQAARPYMEALGVNVVFLVTDSQAAIDEAMQCHRDYPELCSELEWRYVNKTRWSAAEGGWENPFPSGSPEEELFFINQELAIAQECSLVVAGDSGFAEHVYTTVCCGFPLSRRGTRPHRCACPPLVSLIHKEEFDCSHGNEVLCLHNGDGVTVRNVHIDHSAETSFSQSEHAFLSPAHIMVSVYPLQGTSPNVNYNLEEYLNASRASTPEGDSPSARSSGGVLQTVDLLVREILDGVDDAKE